MFAEINDQLSVTEKIIISFSKQVDLFIRYVLGAYRVDPITGRDEWVDEPQLDEQTGDEFVPMFELNTSNYGDSCNDDKCVVCTGGKDHDHDPIEEEPEI